MISGCHADLSQALIYGLFLFPLLNSSHPARAADRDTELGDRQVGDNEGWGESPSLHLSPSLLLPEVRRHLLAGAQRSTHKEELAGG